MNFVTNRFRLGRRVAIAIIGFVVAATAWSQDDLGFYTKKMESLSEGKRLALARQLCDQASDMLNRNQATGKTYDLLLQAYAADPELADTQIELGRYFESWQVGLYGRAFDQYQAALTANPANYRALCHLANLRLRLNQPDQVESLVKQAISLDPGNSWAHSIYSQYLLSTGRHAEALSSNEREYQLRKAASQDLDGDAHFWLTRGTILLNLKRADEAKPALEKARARFLQWNDTWQAARIDALLTIKP